MKNDTGKGSFSYANRHDLPGGEPDFYARTPQAGREFDNNRDPLIARQNADMEKSESRRRFELTRKSSERGSDMVGRHAPKPVLKPSPALAFGADRAAFNRQWQREHRAARKKNKSRNANAAPTVHPIQTNQQFLVRLEFLDAEARENFKRTRRKRKKSKRKSQSR